MAKLEAGIFSAPSGNNNGLVFGKARTKNGKKTTVREKVIPSNPNTTGQQNQRSRFTFALRIVKAIGRNIWEFAWDSAVGGLAGFQSLMSLFTNALSSTGGTLSPPQSVSLGARHFPDSLSASAGTDEIDVTWSTEVGDIGASDDEVTLIAVAVDPDSGETTRTVLTDQSTTRTDGSATISFTGVATGDFVVGMYLKGVSVGIPSGEVYSQAEWVTIS